MLRAGSQEGRGPLPPEADLPPTPRTAPPTIRAWGEWPTGSCVTAVGRGQRSFREDWADDASGTKTSFSSAQKISVTELVQSRNRPKDFKTVKVSKRLSFQDALSLQQTKLHRDPWVLSPQFHPSLQWWDLFTMLALVYVAVVTPAEVALLETGLDAMFFINRLVDLVFVVDMVLQFFVAYPVKTPLGHRLETRRGRIKQHYLRTWFLLDLFSVLPFDSLGLLLSSEALEKAKLMKVLRLLRLIKLSRICRASRVFRRWETSVAINYNTLNLGFAFVVFMLVSHWIACVWAVMALQAEEGESWVDHSAPAAGEAPAGPVEIYLTALYWSSMTVTSVGYGDVLPVNLMERVVCTLLIFVSCMLWTYALGEMMTAMGNRNVHEAHFRQMLDDLNHMMSDRDLPKSMQRRMRSFFFQIKDLARVQGYTTLVERMSPSLQGELAVCVNEVWVRKVWYFDLHYGQLPRDFVSGLAKQLEVMVHTQRESFGEPWTLYILHRGLCVRSMRILHTGSVWGEDFILSSPELLDAPRAVCLTFIELSSLTRENFASLAKKFPEVWGFIRWAIVRMAVKRGLLREAARRAPSKRHRGSFMNFASRTRSLCSLPDEGADFPMPATAEAREPERAAGLRAELQEVAAKQAQMQQQLTETRGELHDKLAKIQGQLDLLLRSRH